MSATGKQIVADYDSEMRVDIDGHELTIKTTGSGRVIVMRGDEARAWVDICMPVAYLRGGDGPIMRIVYDWGDRRTSTVTISAGPLADALAERHDRAMGSIRYLQMLTNIALAMIEKNLDVDPDMLGYAATYVYEATPIGNMEDY